MLLVPDITMMNGSSPNGRRRSTMNGAASTSFAKESFVEPRKKEPAARKAAGPVMDACVEASSPEPRAECRLDESDRQGVAGGGGAGGGASAALAAAAAAFAPVSIVPSELETP